jgi:hypothetical protein
MVPEHAFCLLPPSSVPWCCPWLIYLFSYYVLVAACVLARKKEWLRNACLAAALILPAVAAIHGIVLAAVHVDGTSCRLA